MLISSIALLAFMLFVSFTVWPQAVLVVSFGAGVLVTLQYLLFGAHRIVLGVRWAFKKIGARFSRLLSRSTEAEPTGEEKDVGSPTPTFVERDDDSPTPTIVEKDDSPTPTIGKKVVGSGEKEGEKKV